MSPENQYFSKIHWFNSTGISASTLWYPSKIMKGDELKIQHKNPLIEISKGRSSLLLIYLLWSNSKIALVSSLYLWEVLLCINSGASSIIFFLMKWMLRIWMTGVVTKLSNPNGDLSFILNMLPIFDYFK